MASHNTSLETKNGMLHISFVSKIARDSQVEVLDIIPEEMLDSEKESAEFDEYFNGWMEEKLARYEQNKDKFVVGFNKDGSPITKTVSREEYIERLKEAEAGLRESFESLKMLDAPKKLASDFCSDIKGSVFKKKNKDLSDLHKEELINVFEEIVQGMSFRLIDIEREAEELRRRVTFYEKKNDFRENQIRLWQAKTAKELIISGFKKLFRLE